MPGMMLRAAVLVGLLIAAGTAAAGESVPRIRSTDPRLRSLVAEGVRTSDAFRVLVERLERSDVIVYVQCDTHAAGGRSAGGGRLAFLTAAGGFRYVVVRMAWLQPRQLQIAMLAHELQHAVEIADTPDIVDAQTLAHEYGRMTDAVRVDRAARTAFDTGAAVEMGERVLRELTRATGD